MNDTAEKVQLKMQTQLNKSIEIMVKIARENSTGDKLQNDKSTNLAQSVTNIKSAFKRQKRTLQVNKEMFKDYKRTNW